MPATVDTTQAGGLPRWLRRSLIFAAAFALAFGAVRLARAEAELPPTQSQMPAHAAPLVGAPIV